MSTYTCAGCGDEYTVGRGGDPFTSFSVSRHHQDAEDFAVSVCADCAANVVDDIERWYDAKQEVDAE